MAVQKYVDGAAAPWQTAFNAADLNSLANGSAILSSVADIANHGAGDLYADLSFQLGSIVAASPNYLGVFVFPLNSDGSTYGDNQLVAGTQAGKVPSAAYWGGNLMFPLGTATVKGTVTRILLPFRSLRFAL